MASFLCAFPHLFVCTTSLRRVEEFMVWHFTTKCTVLKCVKPWMLSHFSEPRDNHLRWFDHVSRMSQKRLARQDLLPTLTVMRPRVVQEPGGEVLHLRPCLVSSWCGASRTVRNCWKPWSTSSPPRSAAPATLLREKADVKVNEMRQDFYKNHNKRCKWLGS